MRCLICGFYIVLNSVIGTMLWTTNLYAASDPLTSVQNLLAALSPQQPIHFCNEKVPLDSQQVKERFEKEMMLILWDRPQVLLWLKRSSRYFPEIERQLSQAGIPDDLKYMAVVESALRPHAGSNKGAIGFWQLMPETARKYGLTVNDRVDQRRAIHHSTRAALSYLQDLHRHLKSWTLAVAGYNMGEEGLTAEILEQDTHDYYQLYLPLETQQFLLRIVAIKLIFSDTQRFGFLLEDDDRYPPMKSDTLALDIFDDTPLRLVAKAANTHFKTIKDLNPELRGHYIAPGHYNMMIPEGGSKGFLDRFRDLSENHEATMQSRIYIVKPGDNLSTIADKYQVPLAALLIWNRIKLNHPIHPGDRLVIYPEKP
jgi:membrane-bound lytic murein transglycosylase D